MKKLSKRYRDYLRSDDWKALREVVFRQQGHTCAACRVAKATDIHHLTYGRKLIWIRAEALRPVCRECHDVIHWLKDRGKLIYRSHKAGRRWKQTLAVMAEHGLLPEN